MKDSYVLKKDSARWRWFVKTTAKIIHTAMNYRGLLMCLTLRVLMSYIYGAPILDVSRSHTTTQHSR